MGAARMLTGGSLLCVVVGKKDTNAFTTEDYTCYHITASSSSLELIMDLESGTTRSCARAVNCQTPVGVEPLTSGPLLRLLQPTNQPTNKPDRFQFLEYSVADFQKEARAVLGEYNKVNDWSYICARFDGTDVDSCITSRIVVVRIRS